MIVRARVIVRARAVLACVASLALASLAPIVSAKDVDGSGLTPAQVLDRYAAALAKQTPIKAVTFDYTVSQLGLRDMEQSHRVYRSLQSERDETTVIDGQQLTSPEVRIFANRVYRYDVHAIAPTRATYAFAYTGARYDGDDITYVFRTTPLAAHAFAISEIELPSRAFLPTVLRFRVKTASVSGSGQFSYAPSEGHWVIREAHVNAHLANGALAHERIAWSNYQFPASLPASTFVPPRTLAVPDLDTTPEPSTTVAPLEPGPP